MRANYQLVFDKFEELKSAGAVWRDFRRHGIKLLGQGGVWRDPSRATIVNILRNPAYAGVYQFGLTEPDETRDLSPKGRRRRARCSVGQRIWKEDHHDGYITLVRFWENQRVLNENKHPARPFPGRGEPLVQGLLWCTIHKKPFHVTYDTRSDRLDTIAPGYLGTYRCAGDNAEPDGHGCCQAKAIVIDQSVERELFRVFTPPSVEDVREAARREDRAYEAAVNRREDEVRRALQELERMERLLAEVDVDQPLLKRRLRQHVEEELQKIERLKEAHQLDPLPCPVALSEAELTELHRLNSNVSTLWRHPAVTPQQRKGVVRSVIKRVYVTPTSESWRLEVEWAGGDRTPLEVMTHAGVLGVIRHEYEDEGRTVAEISARLVERGIVQRAGPAAGRPFTTKAVSRWVFRMGLQSRVDLEAYRCIRDRQLQGESRGEIASGLNTRGLRHRLGKWNAALVGDAITRLRRRAIPGVEPLPPCPRWDKDLEDKVGSLHKAELWPTEIAKKLAAAGVRSKYGRIVRHSTVLQVLSRLGLHPNSMKAAEQTKARLSEWVGTMGTDEMARRLNDLGLRTMRGDTWTASSVMHKLLALGLLKVARERVEGLLRLTGGALDLAQMTTKLNDLGLRNRCGNRWTEETLRRRLANSGIRFRRRRTAPTLNRVVGRRRSSTT